MSDRYIVRIAVWPHSTGRGQDVDQTQAGRLEQVFEVRATDFRDACERADLIALGISSNPIVWQSPILEVRKLKHDEHAPIRFDAHSADLNAAAKLRRPGDDFAQGVLSTRIRERDRRAEKVDGKPVEMPEELIEVPLWALRLVCFGKPKAEQVAEPMAVAESVEPEAAHA